MKPTPTAAWLERYTDWVMRHPQYFWAPSHW